MDTTTPALASIGIDIGKADVATNEMVFVRSRVSARRRAPCGAVAAIIRSEH